MKKWNQTDGKYTITPEYAQHLIRIGEQAKTPDDVVRLMNEHGDSHSVVYCLWGGHYKTRGRWMDDFDIEEKTWRRIGEPKYDPLREDWIASRNYRDGINELGISVMDADWEKTVSAAFIKTSAAERGIYEMKGIQIGWGSDGEPVIVPTSVPKKVEVE